MNYINKLSKPGIFRLFLAILVVLFHASRYFPFGGFAVSTFFILSGYWIYRMYDTYYSKQKHAYRTFMFSRILRIFPLYYLCVFIALCLVYINTSLFDRQLSDFLNFKQIFSIVTLTTYNYLDDPILITAWSLAIELQFYLIAPLLIFFLQKTNGIWFFIIVCLLSVYGMVTQYGLVGLSVLTYLIYFGIGMLIWYYKPIISKKIVIWSLFLITIIIALHYTIPILQQAVFTRELKIGEIKYFVIFGRILPLFFIPFIIFNLNQKSGKTDRILGDLSFTVYIFHWIPFSIYNYYFAKSPAIIRGPAFIGYLAILGICCWIIYISFEKRVENLRENLLNRK